MHAWAIPQPKTSVGIRIRWGTLTIRNEEKGCQHSCAIGAIDPTSEYWLPVRWVSSFIPKVAPYPRTVLSRIWRKYTQMRTTRMTRSVLRRMRLLSSSVNGTRTTLMALRSGLTISCPSLWVAAGLLGSMASGQTKCSEQKECSDEPSGDEIERYLNKSSPTSSCAPPRLVHHHSRRRGWSDGTRGLGHSALRSLRTVRASLLRAIRDQTIPRRHGSGLASLFPRIKIEPWNEPPRGQPEAKKTPTPGNFHGEIDCSGPRIPGASAGCPGRRNICREKSRDRCGEGRLWLGIFSVGVRAHAVTLAGSRAVYIRLPRVEKMTRHWKFTATDKSGSPVYPHVTAYTGNPGIPPAL